MLLQLKIDFLHPFILLFCSHICLSLFFRANNIKNEFIIQKRNYEDESKNTIEIDDLDGFVSGNNVEKKFTWAD